jgi:thioredoxin reductase (NADPH)
VADPRDVLIIGSGPAGHTAALYTARANLEPLVLEGEPSSTSDQPGGQLMLTTDVENFPGFVDGVQGPELMTIFKEQAARFGAKYVTVKANKVDLSVRPFVAWADDEEYRARAVIIATGARSLMLGLESERRLLGYGLSTCATCDGFFHRGEDIVVVGGGDSALEEAIFLTRFADKVTVVHRRDQLRASKIMQDRAFANDKISFVWDSAVEDVVGEGAVSGARVRNLKTDETTELEAKGIFVAIGHTPNTALFEGQLEMDGGYVIVEEPSTRTSVDGVFAAGDVVDRTYKQAVTAAGMGAKAAMDAERFLESLGH